MLGSRASALVPALLQSGRLVRVLAAILPWPAALLAQEAAPAPATLALARAFVAVVDSGDVTAFLDRHLAAGADRGRIESLMRAVRAEDGVTLERVEPIADGVGLHLRARNADRGTLIFLRPDAGDSTRVAWLESLAILPPAAATPRAFPASVRGERTVARAVAGEVARLAALDAFSGVVLVAHGDRVVLRAAHGLANAERGERVTSTTRFHLASTGKLVTTAAVARLVARGRLALDDSLGALLPDVRWPDGARGATVRELLAHTAGFGDIFSQPGYDRARRYRPGDLVAEFATRPLEAPPGRRWSYSNLGFEILAAIVERFEGADFEVAYGRLVLGPAGARVDADPVPTAPGYAVPYAHRDDDLVGASPRESSLPKLGHGWSGAGGGYASADDLFRILRAFTGGGLVPRALLDTLAAPRNSLGPGRAYGYGLMVREVAGRRLLGHGGGGSGVGICNRVATRMDGSWTVVILSNVEPPSCEALADRLEELLAAQ